MSVGGTDLATTTSRRGVADPRRLPLCPRCGYEGAGITYFSRGSHVAALVGATVLTAGMMGAGGIIYYLVRRDHRVCPRCGRGWGRSGERALVTQDRDRSPETRVPGSGRERAKRGWSVALFLLTAVLVFGAIAGGEVAPILFAAFSAMGAVALQLSANSDREARRAALVSSLQLPVLKLASARGGRLTVTQVAAELGWTLRRAEKVLHSLDDGLRVDSEVTDEGVIVYEFRELYGSVESGGDPPRLADG
jgi:hypothetical protein